MKSDARRPIDALLHFRRVPYEGVLYYVDEILIDREDFIAIAQAKLAQAMSGAKPIE